MRSLLVAGFAASLLLSGCQNKNLNIQYAKNPAGKSVVSHFDVDSAISDYDCSDHDSRKSLKAIAHKLSKHDLSVRAKAQLRLVNNFIAENADCKSEDAVKESKQRYFSLSHFNALNTPFSLNVNVAYHPDEKAQVDKTFKDFGPLRMDHSKQSVRMDAAYGAWSGYWYPVSNINVLIGKKSPLAKLDSVLTKIGRADGIIDYENGLYDLANADSWEGHCHAWSIASVIFPEPLKAKKVHGKWFSINDIKGIFTKAAEATPYTQYGITYRGNHETDGTFQDLRPEAFHHIVVEQLKANQPILIDDDAGPEVWTRPVLSMRSEIKPDPKVRNALYVRTWLEIIKQKNDLKEELTDKDDASFWVLSYRLYLDPQRFGAKRKVIAGEWLGDSFQSHPDVIIVPDMDSFKSNNPVINKNLDLIEKFY